MPLAKTEDLLLACAVFLETAGRPMHIGDIARFCLDEGLASEMDLEKAKHDVYCKLWGEMKKHGDASRWQRVGKGLWCHVLHLTPELLAKEEEQRIKPLAERRETARLEGRPLRVPQSDVPEADRRCGNCTHLTFYGIHFLHLDSGWCSQWPNQGEGINRPYPRVECEACPFWKQRTAAQREADKREQLNDRLAILGGGHGPCRKKGTVVRASAPRRREETEDDA